VNSYPGRAYFLFTSIVGGFDWLTTPVLQCCLRFLKQISNNLFSGYEMYIIVKIINTQNKIKYFSLQWFSCFASVYKLFSVKSFPFLQYIWRNSPRPVSATCLRSNVPAHISNDLLLLVTLLWNRIKQKILPCTNNSFVK